MLVAIEWTEVSKARLTSSTEPTASISIRLVETPVTANPLSRSQCFTSLTCATVGEKRARKAAGER